MTYEAKLAAPFPAFAGLGVRRAVGHCRGGDRAFVSPAPAAGIVVSLRLMNLLSILLGCNSFAGIQKAAVD